MFVRAPPSAVHYTRLIKYGIKKIVHELKSNSSAGFDGRMALPLQLQMSARGLFGQSCRSQGKCNILVYVRNRITTGYEY